MLLFLSKLYVRLWSKDHQRITISTLFQIICGPNVIFLPLSLITHKPTCITYFLGIIIQTNRVLTHQTPVLTHSRRRTAGGRLHFRLRCAPQKTPCHELKKKYEGFWGREHLQMQHMTSDGCRRSSHSHENERPPETSSPEFPHRIGLFPPRKTRPGIKRVGKNTTGKAEKSSPTWRARPCSFSPVTSSSRVSRPVDPASSSLLQAASRAPPGLR
jgi:hypothetical protein